MKVLVLRFGYKVDLFDLVEHFPDCDKVHASKDGERYKFKGDEEPFVIMEDQYTGVELQDALFKLFSR